MAAVPERTIGRLSLYRRLLAEAMGRGVRNLYSHELASLSGASAAQVRRDLMSVGYMGTPTRGYDVADLMGSIAAFLDAPVMQGVALVGVGNLGRAVLAYFAGRHPSLSFVAAFDADPSKTDRVIHGCRCHGMNELAAVLEREDIRTAVIAVPAEHAQDVADALVSAGIASILNFAPTSLRVPPGVYVEHNDLTASIERVAFFARAKNLSHNLRGAALR
jgi:redox-sensing transcriptional repressor